MLRKLMLAILFVPLFYCSHKANKPDDSQYKAFADEHYLASVFFDWWEIQDTSVMNTFSHRIFYDSLGNPIRSDEYYENIGRYDQFQVGWDDIGINHPPPPLPSGEAVMSPHRQNYLDLWNKAH
jgi:hypothetical protein